ncbi:hypothetical protein EIN_431200 [Entamoeba invadens IP1]|uniref:Uncharacterized protein n=1 Tax=Entamoeba invadens IP1 TaxID=370355 RepID=A0A0A1UGY9_ENTIV|nr:hypothetical protein EIN_431200 [Entamoeba invadens IP1]ELP95284.1 hypothetical protein EIN_431200 [Entamoeba invadens IP1]|eukprot:XP_004262055.1 hypothetical protein EIN_431200 [Entamoeba invadens IP1]
MEEELKVVPMSLMVIGEHHIGKSCLISQVLEGGYKESVHSTLVNGVDFDIKRFLWDRRIVNLTTFEVWNNGYSNKTIDTFCKTRHPPLCFICYDCKTMKHFDNVGNCFSLVNKHFTLNQIHLVGLRYDTIEGDIHISPLIGAQKAAELNIAFHLTSAKTREGISDIVTLFHRAREDVVDKFDSSTIAKNKENVIKMKTQARNVCMLN